ncbi:hypothetical protein [Streptomyces sp. A012304]|uniref:hypothetical protein n=1 Tax=Streptomyces sp. A012304 TaxID=375446 RepID=UPI002230A4F3|nr:hypothetical protein [Streptomyces sp. A012304]GKQ40160.1 hypothetical protein ALMP_66860 [Streptomyces sp. A012304]
MSNVSAEVSLAGGKSEIFEFFLRFMPEWVQITVLALIVLAVLASWILKLKRKIAHRRAVRAGVPVHAAAQPGQGSGADYLGAYAPQQNQTAQPSAAPSGADFLGAYAPQQSQAAPAAQTSAAPSGADFLGAYAPQQRPDATR